MAVLLPVNRLAQGATGRTGKHLVEISRFSRDVVPPTPAARKVAAVSITETRELIAHAVARGEVTLPLPRKPITERGVRSIKQRAKRWKLREARAKKL